jgi:hypothetical protein
MSSDDVAAALDGPAREERLGELLFRHLEGIAAYCDHPVRFGAIESVLKLKWTFAHPIRSAGAG